MLFILSYFIWKGCLLWGLNVNAFLVLGHVWYYDKFMGCLSQREMGNETLSIEWSNTILQSDLSICVPFHKIRAVYMNFRIATVIISHTKCNDCSVCNLFSFCRGWEVPGIWLRTKIWGCGFNSWLPMPAIFQSRIAKKYHMGTLS